MALREDPPDNGDLLPIFNVEKVQLNFNIASDFVAGQVANNVLILALATNRILRIDLDNPADIDGEFPMPRVAVQLRAGFECWQTTIECFCAQLQCSALLIIELTAGSSGIHKDALLILSQMSTSLSRLQRLD